MQRIFPQKPDHVYEYQNFEKYAKQIAKRKVAKARRHLPIWNDVVKSKFEPQAHNRWIASIVVLHLYGD